MTIVELARQYQSLSLNQSAWTQTLRQRMESHNMSVRQLAAMLNVSESNTHRRLRGSTPWTLQEYLSLSQLFGIDPALSLTDNAVLRLIPSEAPSAPFEAGQYLENLLLSIERFDPEKGRLRIVATDLPIMFFLRHPILLRTKLKLFEQARSTGMISLLRKEDLKLDERLRRRCEKVQEIFMKIPSQQVWSPNPVDGLLKQLGTLRDLGTLNSETSELIIEDLQALANSLEAYILASTLEGASSELRFDPNRVSGAIFQVSQPDLGSYAYITFDSPHHLASIDQESAAYFEAFAKTAFHRARPISTDAVQVHRYLQRLHRTIDLACDWLRSPNASIEEAFMVR